MTKKAYSSQVYIEYSPEYIIGLSVFCFKFVIFALYIMMLLRWASLVAQLVKNLPAMWEIWVQSLGWEDRLEKGKATHSSILAWKIPWMEEPGRLQSVGSQRVEHN